MLRILTELNPPGSHRLKLTHTRKDSEWSDIRKDKDAATFQEEYVFGHG